MDRLFYGLIVYGCGVAWLAGVINFNDGFWGYFFRGFGVLIIAIGAYIITSWCGKAAYVEKQEEKR